MMKGFERTGAFSLASLTKSLSTHLLEEFLHNLLRRIRLTICMSKRFAGYLENINI